MAKVHKARKFSIETLSWLKINNFPNGIPNNVPVNVEQQASWGKLSAFTLHFVWVHVN